MNPSVDDRCARRFSRFGQVCVGAALCLQAVAEGNAQSTSLQLSILASTNHVASGSGSGLGLPDGRFTFAPPNVVPDFQFAPPIAASGGRFIFQAAVQQRDGNGNPQGIDTGIWAGTRGNTNLTMLFRQRLAAPPLGSNFTHYGQYNISAASPATFFAQTGAPVPDDGLWWGSTSASGAAGLTNILRMDLGSSYTLFPTLQSSNYVAFFYGTTNWLYHTQTGALQPASYVGMPATVFGAGLTITNTGTIVALTDDGRLLHLGTTSDGTNRLFLVNGSGVITPIISQGDLAPGIANRRMGIMSVSGNGEGNVAVLVTRLIDGDANQFNDRSALFAGSPTNLTLIAQSPFGQLWGGGTFLSRSNYFLGYEPSSNGYGIYKLPSSTNGTLSFTPIPTKPYPPLAGQVLLGTSLNALGQYAEVYGNTGEVNQKNRGNDLWLFNPGNGWTNLARSGMSLVASGQTIPVNDIGFMGSVSGAGYGSGLADDGTLVFSIATHIITLSEEAAHDFYWTGLLGPNWHTSVATSPFTSWESVEKIPRQQPPGDAEPDTARVFINAFPGETIDLDQRPASIGSLMQSNGLLRLREHLTLNRTSRLENVRMEAPAGSLTVNENSTANLLEWVTGKVNGMGQLLATNLYFTNSTTTRLETILRIENYAQFDGEGTMILSNAAIRNYGTFGANSGTLTNHSGSQFQNSGWLIKDRSTPFTIHTPYQAFEPPLRIPPWGIQVDEGKLSLLGGGLFIGQHTNEVFTDATLEMAGTFDVQPELTIFRGNGTLDLGTTNQDINLNHIGYAKSLFAMGSDVVNLHRGRLGGDFGMCTNLGKFIWKGGNIAIGGGPIGTGSLVNEGLFGIDDSAAQVCKLDGRLINGATVFHHGSFELNGTVINNGDWLIDRPLNITTNTVSGVFSNQHLLLIGLSQSGTVNIDARIYNAPWNPAAENGLIVGNSSGPTTTVQLRGEVLNLKGNTLDGGFWMVNSNAALTFPREVEEIAAKTAIDLFGGSIPSLKLKQNSGQLNIENVGYATLGSLTNTGTLSIAGTATVTVNGNYTDSHEIVILPPGKLQVNGNFVSSGTVNASGGINATGSTEFNGRIGGSGTVQGGFIGIYATITPGASPGTLKLIGPTTLGAASRLVIELAGSQSNRFDALAVSGPITLGGNLSPHLIDGFVPAPGDTFPIVQATSVIGQFANATNGQRITTIDGYGSFVVNYTITNVILSSPQLTTNPPASAPAMLGLPTFEFDGTTHLPLTGTPGRQYQLLTSTNLVNWETLSSGYCDAVGLLNFEFPRGNEPKRFFRAVATAPAPVISGIVRVGGNLQIDFTALDAASPALFTLQNATLPSGTFADVSPSATIVQTSPGHFQTMTPLNGLTRFYRIKR